MSADPIATALMIALDHGNIIGYSELSHAASIASVARRGATLTERQRRAAHRLLTRYAAELHAAGISLPAAPPSPEPQTSGPGPRPPDGPTSDVLVRVCTYTDSRGVNSGPRIGVSAPHRFNTQLKLIYGAKPYKDPTNGKFEWHYPVSPANAAALLDLFAGQRLSVGKRVVDLAADHNGRGQRQVALDESEPLPDFDTTGLIRPQFTLWDHQRRSARFALDSVASLHAIGMGGGKTLSTITAINLKAREDGPQRVVIVCPNKVRGVWPREVRKFSALEWHIVDGSKLSKRARHGRVSLKLAQRLHEAEECLFDCACGAPVHAVVINYEAFAREPWQTWRPSQRIDVAVYDEIHRIKSHKMKTSNGGYTQSGALAQWVGFTAKRIGLTGTPMPQTPLDVFGIFRALDPGIFGLSWSLFRSTYAITNPHVEEMVVGYRNVVDMAKKFFSITYLPVIDLDLPAVTDITREFELEADAQKVYDSLDQELWADLSGFGGGVANAAVLRQLDEELDALAREEFESITPTDPIFGGGVIGGAHERIREEGSTVTPANIMVKLLRLQQLTGGTVIDDEGNRIRVSKGKAELLAEVLDEVGCSRADDHEPEPTVVFCRFRSDLDVVRETAEAAGLRYAEVSGRRHDGLTYESEMNPDADIVGVQIQSGGTGVDLTRARVAVWYSLGYSLSDYDQARKRLDRPGQTRPVVMVHLLATGTADFDVYGALDGRRSVIASVIATHGIDPAKLGLVDDVPTEEDLRRIKGGQGAVELPFQRLIEAEAVRLGQPVGSWKVGA